MEMRHFLLQEELKMANITKRGDTFRIKVSCGYDVNGKQVIKSMTRDFGFESVMRNKTYEGIMI